MGSFQHHTQPDVALGNFDQGHLGPALNVVAWGTSDMTDLCLYLNTEIVPEQPDHRDSHPRPPDSCIPGLSAPPETTVEPQGGQFSPERADSYASIATNLDLVSINDHYSAQLRDAGWTLAEQASDASLVLSAWRFTCRSHPYSATMELAKRPDGQIAGQIHAAQEASA